MAVDAKRAQAILVMHEHGIINPAVTFDEAARAKLPLELACALLDQETGGGRNVFGHDPTIFVGAGNVTRLKYAAYKIRRRISRNRLMQGVGPCQLTWWATQDEADRLGGCWKPVYNIRVGFTHLAANIKRDGLKAGIAAYNGSGPAAQRYAISVQARAAYWKKLLP